MMKCICRFKGYIRGRYMHIEGSSKGYIKAGTVQLRCEVECRSISLFVILFR